MRDRLPRTARPMNTTGTPTSVPVVDWRTDVRPLVIRDLADLVKRLEWSTPLLIALLEELHVTEEFDRLIGRLRLQPDRDAPRLLALALFLRHSWDHDDLAAVVNQVLFPPPRHRRSVHAGHRTWRSRQTPSLTGVHVAFRASCAKGVAMTESPVPRSSESRGHRVRELVCSYRTLRDANGDVQNVPTLALSTPRVAATTLGPLLATELVEVFAVACLSARHHLLTWHVVSRGTRTSTPISIPDVFVPACLTPGTTGLIVVHNHPSGVMRTPGICGVGGATLDSVEPKRTWTPHNQSPSRNASSRSLAWYRQRPLGGVLHLRQCPFFHAEVRFDIEVGGVETFVPEPERDD